MNILYLSVLVSPSALREAENTDRAFSAYAVQKFHHLLTRGLVKNGAIVSVLSTFYLPRVGKGFFRKSEYCDGVHFDYIPTLNSSLFRHPWLVAYCFVRVLLFGIFNRHEKVLFCDVLNVSACMGAVAAAKLIGLRRVGIVTDMPEFAVGVDAGSRQNLGKKIFSSRLNMKTINGFSHFVFLTEQMNPVLNKKGKPYIIMEGLVDSSFVMSDKKGKKTKKIVLYAGGIDEKYGLGLLVEGFIHAQVKDSELHIYGDGPFVPRIKEYDKEYANVFYMGIQPNKVIVEKEQEATLLVNPRPTKEDFTKYSFPSKNMEYMLSGIPLLTTKLPGMPQEYYPYVYLFEEESIEGYAGRMMDVLSLPAEELRAKGMRAREWVVDNKNNIVQAKKIMDLI